MKRYIHEEERLPCSPVALHRPPVAHDEHHVPRVGELVLRDLHSRFVADALGVSGHFLARQTGIAARIQPTGTVYS